MFRRLYLAGTIGAVLLLFVGCQKPMRRARPARELPEARAVSTVQLPQVVTRGVALVEGRLWTLDAEARQLNQIDARTGRTVRSLKTRLVEPRGLAWDGKFFWAADDKSKTVHQIDAATGRITRSFDVPIDGPAEDAHLEGLACDNGHLWIAYAAGYSSRILRMDAKTGKVTQSMLAHCLPRGLAADGKYLWIATYNLGRYGGTIRRLTVMDDPDAMTGSAVFVVRLRGKEPTDIALDGKHLWTADQVLSTLEKIELPARQD